MKKFINRWHYISVFLAAATAMIAIFAPGDILQKLILASMVILFLHFFEEFGFPGGFPSMAVRVLMGKDEPDSSKWGSNNLGSMFGNWLFLVAVYLLPLLLPEVRFLTMAVMLFNLAELLMHGVLFNVREKKLYNPGAITAILGMAPISIYYFAAVFEASAFEWYDYVLAVAWFGFIFWLTFRSPWYWKLGNVKGYGFNDQTAYGIAYVENQQSAGHTGHAGHAHH